MKHIFLHMALTALLLGMAVSASASQPKERHDSLEIGLVTCAPGDAVYELYGHTAIRVINYTTGGDWIFNYGVFDFNTPHFAWRFMMGRTDYILNVVPTDRFVANYAHQGREVKEQVISLTPSEKERIFNTLDSIIRIPDWSYRYNFLYDNCTTRAISTITSGIEERIIWPKGEQGKSFREIIHEFAAPHSPWYCFGQDLILGEETDRQISRAQQMFAPIYAMHYASTAYIVGNDGSHRPLVAQTRILSKQINTPNGVFPISPMAASLFFLITVIALSVWAKLKKQRFIWIDYIILLLQGGTGCIVGLLFFFSVHPAVGSNWLIFLLNPIPLCYLIYMVWQRSHGNNDHYRPVLLVETLIILLAFIITPQTIPTEAYVLALILPTRLILVGNKSIIHNITITHKILRQHI